MVCVVVHYYRPPDSVLTLKFLLQVFFWEVSHLLVINYIGFKTLFDGGIRLCLFQLLTQLMSPCRRDNVYLTFLI